MRTLVRHRLLAVAVVVVCFAVGAAACGSDDGPPSACEGLACVEGVFDSSTPEGSTTDGPVGDAPSDAPNDSDAGACNLQESDAGDAGPSGTLQWALNFGVSGYTFPSTVARDPANGDIVVTGYFWGTTDFGGGALTSVAANDGSGSDVFLARLDKSGAYRWAGAWGNGANLAANTVAVGPSGEMVVGGILREGSLDFGNGCDVLTSTGSPDIFLAKFEKAGLCTWAKRFGVAGQTQNIMTVAVDSTGSVLLSGRATGGLDFGGGPRTGFFLAKLSSSGAHAWSKSFAATTSYFGPWLALDPQGNPILAGTFSKSIDLGGSLLSTAGADAGDTTNAAFVAKFDPTGAHVWSRAFGQGTSANNTSITGVATDACGNIHVNGPFSGTVNFGAGPLSGTDVGKSYGFLAKLDGAGKATWSKSFVGTNQNMSTDAFVGWHSVAVDRTGGATIDPVLVGSVAFGEQESVDFGGGALTNVGQGSAAVASFGPTGAHRWSYVAGGPSTARASTHPDSVGVAPWGSSVVLAGSFTKCTTLCATSPAGTTIVLAGKTLTGVSGQDMFLASFTP